MNEINAKKSVTNIDLLTNKKHDIECIVVEHTLAIRNRFKFIHDAEMYTIRCFCCFCIAPDYLNESW